jgi:hypothetical protein
MHRPYSLPRVALPWRQPAPATAALWFGSLTTLVGHLCLSDEQMEKTAEAVHPESVILEENIYRPTVSFFRQSCAMTLRLSLL